MQPPDPRFNLARGAATLTTAPPFDFSNVVMRTFPLKANLWSLRQFCNETLNLAPEIVEFEPAMPFVFLQILSYGKMSTEVANAGWVSQHEILFSVPLLWYRRQNGERVLHDIASVTPVVFVDQSGSQAIGREVYGWPKVLGRLDPGLSAWVKSPREPRTLLELSTTVFTGDGGEPQLRRLVEIRQQPSPTFADVPPDWSDPLNPFATIPQAVLGGLSAGADVLRMLTALPLGGVQADPENLQRMVAAFFDNARAARTPCFNTINLKQFRQAARPDQACFQSITNAQMKLMQFNRGGLLGEPHQLQGDLSGGYRIRIFRYPSQPVIETLGLEVASEEDELAEAPLAVLRPVAPFWVDVDFQYGLGEELCWTGRDGVWHVGRQAVPAAEPATPPVFNAVWGGPSLGGPFSFPDATLRVLPLLAESSKVQEFVDQYLNQGKGGLPRETRFKVWGRYVYLLAASHRAVALGNENLKLGPMRSASFAIPLLWHEAGRPVSAAMLRAYMYTDSDAAAMTAQEVQGWPAVVARLTSPADPWMSASGPAAGKRNLLELETDVLQSLGLGQRAQSRLLIEIGSRPIFPDTDLPAWQPVAADWGERLLAELRRMGDCRRDHPREFLDAIALALDPLALGSPINDVALRQFRDVRQPNHACYQGLSLSRTVLGDLADLREIGGPLHVGIHRYASAPIVSTLGLVVKASQEAAHGMVDWLQPIRPFWMRLGMHSLAGEDFFFRIHSDRWRTAPLPLESPARRRRVGPGLVEFIDSSEFGRRNLAEAVALWHGEEVGNAAAALEAIEPQMVIEALLSRGWGNQGSPLFWRRESDHEQSRQVPDFCVASHSLGPLGPRFEKLHPELQALQGYWYLDAPWVEAAG